MDVVSGDKVIFRAFDDCDEEIADLPIEMSGYFKGQIYTVDEVIDDDLFSCKEISDGWVFDMRWIKVILAKSEGVVEYTFRDDHVNVHQICADAFEDNMKAFLVVGDGDAIIGVLGGGIQIDAEGKQLALETSGYPYNMAQINLEDVGFWRKKLIQYSKDYNAWRFEMNANIKDRSRRKVNDKKFKVMGF